MTYSFIIIDYLRFKGRSLHFMAKQMEFHVSHTGPIWIFLSHSIWNGRMSSIHSFGPTSKQHYPFLIISFPVQDIFMIPSCVHRLTAGQGFLYLSQYDLQLWGRWERPLDLYLWVWWFKRPNIFKTGWSIPPTTYLFPKVLLHWVQSTKNWWQSSKLSVKECWNHRSSLPFHLRLIDESLNHRTSKHDEIKSFISAKRWTSLSEILKPISVDDLAQQCNLNRHYFSRLFKEQVNISPSNSSSSTASAKPVSYWKIPIKPCKKLQRSVGYSNQFNFSTAFKRHFPTIPTKWRREHR